MLGYVARMPLTEVVRFARELDWEDELRGGRQTRACWSGTSEAAALVAALADRTDADVGAVLQALLDRPHPAGLDRPQLATTELLSAISAYSNDVIVTVAMGLNSAVPSLLATFVRITRGILPKILARGLEYNKTVPLDMYAQLLKVAGATLPAEDFCQFYVDLKYRKLTDHASVLLEEAARNPVMPEIIMKMKDYGLRREARQLVIVRRQKNG